MPLRWALKGRSAPRESYAERLARLRALIDRGDYRPPALEVARAMLAHDRPRPDRVGPPNGAA